jgi:hypothetical protein
MEGADGLGDIAGIGALLHFHFCKQGAWRRLMELISHHAATLFVISLLFSAHTIPIVGDRLA